MENGLFVTFEGIEGSGKTTQVKRLHDHLAQTTIPFTFTREPGGTPLSEKLRELLIDPLGQMAPEAEALILSASRAELVHEVVEPMLREGQLVVCDRFWDATIAYQGFGRGLPMDTLMTLTMFASRRLAPDVTVLLDLPVAAMRERLGERMGFVDRLEREGDAFFERVRQGYLRLAAANPQRFVVIDALRREEAIEAEVRDLVLTRWRER